MSPTFILRSEATKDLLAIYIAQSISRSFASLRINVR